MFIKDRRILGSVFILAVGLCLISFLMIDTRQLHKRSEVGQTAVASFQHRFVHQLLAETEDLSQLRPDLPQTWHNVHTWRECARFQCRKMFLNGSETINWGPSRDDLPLCHDLLFEATKRLDLVFRKLSVSYYLMFGSLLGSLQLQDVFSWTSDLDLVLKSEVLEALIDDPDSNELFQEHGFILFRGGMRLARVCFARDPVMMEEGSISIDEQPIVLHDGALPEIRRQRDYFDRHVYIDLYMEYDSTEETLKINPSECVFDRSTIYPLKRCPLRGLYLPCPNRPQDLLAVHYGPRFDEPRDNFTQSELDAFGCL